jgi:hypothetical protein
MNHSWVRDSGYRSDSWSTAGEDSVMSAIPLLGDFRASADCRADDRALTLAWRNGRRTFLVVRPGTSRDGGTYVKITALTQERGCGMICHC